MSEFSFSDSAATNYDTLLVPIIFRPWAESLLEMRSDWAGKNVLDLAAGTGVVTEILAEKVGNQGSVHAVDLNPDMLAIAQKRCKNAVADVTFDVCSADAIELSDNTFDAAVCQQGFQFFPDKPAAAAEVHRLLRKGGHAAFSTWCPIEECDSFHVICQALDSIGEQETSDLMRTPFDFLPADVLEDAFSSAGFNDIILEKVTRETTIDGGVEQAIKAVYGTPIAPRLNALDPEKRSAFDAKLAELYAALSPDGKNFGILTSHVLTARK